MNGRSAILLASLALTLTWPLVVQPQSPADDKVKTGIAEAKALRAAGSSEEARKIYESLLPALRSQGPSTDMVTVLTNLSDIANLAGDYDHAVVLALESASACRSLRDKNCEAQGYGDAGLALSNAGKYEEAARTLDQGLRLNRETGNGQTAALLLNNLGNVYYYQAKYSEALRAYESALEQVNKAAGATSWRPITLANLATLYQRLGNDQRAISMYDQLMQNPAGLTAREVAHILANRGVLYRHLGDGEKALENYRLAESYYARQKDADGELGVLKNIGIVLALELGRPQEALKTFDRAYALAKKTGNQREAMQALLYRGETHRRLNRLEAAEREFQSAFAEAQKLGTVEEQWKAQYALGRIAEQQGRRAVAEDMFRDAVRRIESLRSKLQFSLLKSDFLSDKRDVYDALIKLLLDRQDTAGAFAFMERSRARTFQDRFFTRKLAPEALTLPSIQGRLDQQTALIEFWTGADEVAVVWITSESAGTARTSLPRESVLALSHSVSGLPENLGQDWRTDFQKISALLPSGIPPLSQTKFRHLLVVPDGFLSLLPFEMLAAPSGELLVENRDVTYLPSAVLLLRERERKSRIRFPWQHEFAGFGDPSLVGSGESALTSGGRGDREGALPNSREEIKTIAVYSAGRAQLFLGADDRKQSFLSSPRSGAALLHVSTHAVADMDNPERSRLLFSPDAPDQPNNYLFLKELYDLDLRGVSLATLSACDTERGRLVPGEGIQAFSRALLAAGSDSALTTLWRVPDQPTADFMKQFYYFLLKKHKTKAEALRLSKLEFLHSGTGLSHPRYWAAFVLNGDGSEPFPRFISWPVLIAPLLCLTLGGVSYAYARATRKKTKAATARA